MPVWLENAPHFREGARPIRHVAQTESDREGVELRVAKGKGEAIALAECDVGVGAGGGCLLDLGFVEHRLTEVHADDGCGGGQFAAESEGDVAAASFILGAEGHVRGNIVADAAQISGTVDGTVAAKSLVIEATARINGDLSYDAVSVASGAQVEGRVKRLTSDAEPALKLIASE